MATPVRFPQGVSVAGAWQFFAGMGQPNPFFYHSFSDDFETTPVTANGWTPTASGGTTNVNVSADGGQVQLVTAAAGAAFAEIQRTNATFQPVAGLKLFFVTRLSLSDINATAVVAGLMPVTATPFTNPANGVWVSKASGTTQLVLNVANNSVVTSTNIPTTAITLANNTLFDIGIGITGNSPVGITIRATVGPNLVGFVPQSGTGTANSTNRAPNVVSSAPLITTLQSTVLAPVLAVQTGDGTAKTMNVDFVGVFRER